MSPCGHSASRNHVGDWKQSGPKRTWRISVAIGRGADMALRLPSGIAGPCSYSLQ
jgi:hypothetical protein